MSGLQAALEAIRGRREAILSRGVRLVGVVGSVARAEDGPESDVDVVYEVCGRVSLLALARAYLDLSADLGRTVDLVDLDRVDPEIRAEFERDLVPA